MPLKKRVQAAEPTTSNVEYDNLDETDYDSRLVMVADLGLQEPHPSSESQNPVQSIALGLEICGEDVTVDGETRPRFMWTKPFNIYATLTERGSEIDYYSVFDPSAKPGDVSDWDAQLGKPCSVRIEHVEGKGKNEGKVFDNIAKIVAIPEKYRADVPPARMDCLIGDADEPDNHVNTMLFGLAKYVFDKRLS